MSPTLIPLTAHPSNRDSLTHTQSFSAQSVWTTIAKYIFVIAWVTPPILIAGFLWRFAVDVPLMDDITIGDTVRNLLVNGLSLHELIAQHNEARPAFVRLIFRMLYVTTQWDVRYQMAVSYGVILCTGLVMIHICRQTIQHQTTAMVAAVLINFMLFSPVQWQCLLWGMELVIFILALPLVLIIACLGSSKRLSIMMPLAGAAAIIATFSSANGMLLWFLAMPFFLVHRSTSRLRAFAGWSVLAAITIAFYFHGYAKPPGHPPWWLVFHTPMSAANFLMAFLGNGVRITHDSSTDAILGWIAVGVWACGIAYVGLVARSSLLWRTALPWITLGAYSILSAALTTFGRFGFGEIAAVVPRYCTIAIPLWISIVPLWIVIFDYTLPGQSGPHRISITLTSIGAAVITILMLQGCLFVRGEMLEWNAQALAARSAAQFSLVVKDDDAIQTTLFPGATFARYVIASADRFDCFHPQCFHSNDISAIAVNYQEPNLYTGLFDILSTAGDQLTLAGWACIPSHRSPADAVLLTTPDAAGVERIFAIATNAHLVRYDVANLMKCKNLDRSGWNKTIRSDLLPHGTVISAWAYDTNSRRAYRLEGTHQVP